MANFFRTLKQEVYYGNQLYLYWHLKHTIKDFIKYFKEEINWKLGRLSHADYKECIMNISYLLRWEIDKEIPQLV